MSERGFEECYSRRMANESGSMAAIKKAAKACAEKNHMQAKEIARLGFYGSEPYVEIFDAANARRVRKAKMQNPELYADQDPDLGLDLSDAHSVVYDFLYGKST